MTHLYHLEISCETRSEETICTADIPNHSILASVNQNQCTMFNEVTNSKYPDFTASLYMCGEKQYNIFASPQITRISWGLPNTALIPKQLGYSFEPLSNGLSIEID